MNVRDVHIAVISTGRPENVQHMETLVGEYELFWYIRESDLEAYSEAGARIAQVYSGEPPCKSQQLNLALRYGAVAEQYVLTLDDDLDWFKLVAQYSDKRQADYCTFGTVLKDVLLELDASPFYLAGVSSVTNAYFTHMQTAFHGAIQGKFCLHKPGTDTLYDPEIKEYVDADFAIRHHIIHGGVVRLGRYMVKNKWRTNSGGLVQYRTPELTQAMVTELTRRYGLYGAKFGMDDANRIWGRIPWKKLTTTRSSGDLFNDVK